MNECFTDSLSAGWDWVNKRMIDLNERNPFKPGPRWQSKDKHKKILTTLRTPTLQAQDNANAQIVFCGHSLSS